MNSKFILFALMAIMVSLECAQKASAGFVVEGNPIWTRPTSAAQASSSLTTYQAWDGFDTTQAPNYHNSPNDPNSVNPNGTAAAFDNAAPGDGAFFVGSDIYSFSASLNPQIIVPQYSVANHQLDVLAQVQYYGSDINLNDLLVTYTDASNVSHTVQADTLANYHVTNLYSALSNVGFGEADQADYEWAFTVPNASSLKLNWGWDVTSSAVQDMAVDTLAVPANSPVAVPQPASVWMGLAGMAALFLMRYGRRAICF